MMLEEKTKVELEKAARLLKSYCKDESLCTRCPFSDRSSWKCKLFNSRPEGWDIPEERKVT